MSPTRTRRDFLRSTLGTPALLSLAPSVPTFLARTALAAGPKTSDRDTVLVVVQLAGGNDGLNTIVPHGDDLYAKYRPTLHLPAKELHRIDSLLGFHPRMAAFSRLFQEGLLSVVQGVGYPNPHGGHFESMHIWQTADTSIRGETGWLGRAVDLATRDERSTMPAVYVGQIGQPFTMNAARSVVPTVRTFADATLHRLPGTSQDDRRKLAATISAPRHGPGSPYLNFLQRTVLAADRSSRAIEVASTAATGEYPRLQLAQRLRTVAQLIRADVGLRIIYTELGGVEPGGFDNHAVQLDNHAALLHQLSESVAAFVHDLKRDNLLDRVLLMTFSEFGRTVRENGRRGTDHGSAAPLFLAGGKLKGGLVGAHPNLKDLEGSGGQKHHTDFRRVYATALDRWLGLDSTPVLGKRYEPLDVLRA
jgi:uncharacterized protein (DUF1501 family)